MNFEIWTNFDEFIEVNFVHFCVLGHVAEDVYQNMAVLLGARFAQMYPFAFQLQALSELTTES